MTREEIAKVVAPVTDPITWVCLACWMQMDHIDAGIIRCPVCGETANLEELFGEEDDEQDDPPGA